MEIKQIKLEEELKTVTADVSDMKKKLQTSEKDIENVKKEIVAKTSKLESGHEAVKEDIKILNQKIDEVSNSVWQTRTKWPKHCSTRRGLR